MKVYLAGSGNVGSALFNLPALKELGITVLTREWEKETISEGVVFLAIPDSEVAGILSSSYGEVPDNLRIIHFAGGLGIVRKNVYLLHPYSSINPDTDLREILFTLWGERDPLLEVFLNEIGLRFTPINGEPTIGYHTSAVIAGNFLQYFLYHAKKLLMEEGIEGNSAETLLSQLIENSRQNIFDKGIKGITGPASRGDREVVEAEAEFLKKVPGKLSEIYRNISCEITALTRKK